MVADVTVVGAGIVALTSALALADRGAAVRLVGTSHRGEASEAAGGLLTPSVEPELRAIAPLAHAARDYYPNYVAMLEERSGIAIWLNRNGSLQLARTDAEAETLRSEGSNEGSAEFPESKWLSASDVVALEPALGHVVGAVYAPNDGCVDPLLVLDALRRVISTHSNITVASENACNIHVSSSECEVITDREGHYGSGSLVLAAGAWTPTIAELPMALPVEPVKGQMLAFGAAPVRHVTFGAGGYLVPKATGQTVAGSTLEHVGFDADVTDDGIASIRAMAGTVCPALASAPVRATWAGLRPMTPDLLPIIGADPSDARIVYACGHSRNGILLAPITAEAVADLATGRTPAHDLGRFRPGRF